MPRSRSIFIQSERVLRRSPLALTWPARLIAPPNSSSFSVSVVLPASGCEMIANVRRRATSLASGDADGDSAVRAMSDMASVWQGKRLISRTILAVAWLAPRPHIHDREDGLPKPICTRGRPCLIRRVCHGVDDPVCGRPHGSRLGHRPQIYRRLFAA